MGEIPVEISIENIWTVLLNLLLILVCLIWVNYDFLKRREEFYQSIKGEDRILQITEICIYIWIRSFPIAVFCDLFANWTLSTQAWASIDAIFLGLIAGDIGLKHVSNKKKQ